MANKPKKDPAAMFASLGGDEPETTQTSPIEEGQIEEGRSPQAPPVPQTPPAVRKKGRPAGKRSDPNFTQIGAYIPVELYREVMKRVTAAKYDNPQAPDLSDVIAELLEGWISEESPK